ncbi:MAG: hypothetical protein H7A46_14935 [Verrucomicrobiales bacterium]|nr:hypothetical protein [Verrucomicrobiales bacterium]
MDPNSSFFSRSVAGLMFGLVLALAGTVDLRAQDPDSAIALQAQLIWGTDSAKPDDAKCKEVGAELGRRLSRVFKWKHYYEMRRKPVAVRKGKSTRVEMSGKCVLKFALADPETVEVRLIGEGRLTKTMRQPLKALENGEILVLAGDTKDDINDAWFVVISVPKPEKEKAKDAGAGSAK